MKKFLISVSFGKLEENISFILPGRSIEEITKMFLKMEGKQPIDLDNGYRIINFDRVTYIDVVEESK